MITVKDVVKDYETVRAVDHINFTIEEGEIVGFLGPNGAGKSTTLKMLTGYVAPTSGMLAINGLNIETDSLAARKHIGYLPEQNPLYEEMIVYEYLQFIGKIRGLSEEIFSERISLVINVCGLKDVIDRPIGELSKGYRQRVGLAQAIIHDPQVLILDEPTSGLDPNQILEIRDLIRELGHSKTVILSSHILQEVQAMCDRIIIINKGVIIADGSREELQQTSAGRTQLRIELEGALPEITTLLQEYPTIRIEENVLGTSANEVVFSYPAEEDLRSDIARWLQQQNCLIVAMQKQELSLEAVFHHLTQELQPTDITTGDSDE